MKIFKFNKIFNKKESKNEFTDEEIINIIQKLGENIVIYGSKEQLERIEKLKQKLGDK